MNLKWVALISTWFGQSEIVFGKNKIAKLEILSVTRMLSKIQAKNSYGKRTVKNIGWVRVHDISWVLTHTTTLANEEKIVQSL